MSDSNVLNPKLLTEQLPLQDKVFREAYERVLPELMALGPEELVQVNIDIPSAIATAQGALPEIFAFLPRIEKVGEFDVEQLKKLDTYAMALGRAHALFLLATQPSNELLAMVEEATALRETLLADANALIQRKLLDGNGLKELRGGNGYKNLAFDLEMLAALFKQNLDRLQGKIPTTRAELDRAEELCASIVRAVGMREQGPSSVAATTDVRARAFAAFTHTYDQARRVITYLRWIEEDVDSIAPSLFAGRGGRKKVPAEPPNPTKSGAPAEPPATGAPAAPVTASNTDTPTTPGTPAAAHVVPGSPKEDPFL